MRTLYRPQKDPKNRPGFNKALLKIFFRFTICRHVWPIVPQRNGRTNPYLIKMINLIHIFKIF